MAGAADRWVDLGFMETDYEAWEVESRHFPSKVGGAPAWLDLATLPKPQQLQCSGCEKPRNFLLQVYSPDSKVSGAFHRSLLVFLCLSPDCWTQQDKAPVLILRCQLGRCNPYYPMEAPEDGPGGCRSQTAQGHGALCPVCGCRGDKTCAGCKQVHYCSPSHQRLHWSKGGHKAACKEGGAGAGQWSKDNRFLLKQGVLDMETEPQEERSDKAEDLEQYQHLIQGGVEADPKELEEIEAGQKEDLVCSKFRSRVSRAPDQVVRHDRGGLPLLCAAKPDLTPPKPCQLCGANRTFEMQVMPQLLSKLGLGLDPTEGGVDWGSLYIYTCSKSCHIIGYVEEEVQLLNFERSNLPGT